MQFKFQEHFAELEGDCPPKAGYSQKDVEAYRFCWEPVENPNNWLPQILLPFPAHPNSKQLRGPRCEQFALSFFVRKEDAQRKYQSFAWYARNEKPSSIGEFLAAGIINADDGICEEADKSGHFNVHPSELSAFEKTFNILGRTEEL